MNLDSPAPADRPRRWWGVLRAVVLVMWLAAAGASWWLAPRQATYDEAKAAVAGRRVTAYQWGDSWKSDESGHWFGGSTLRSTGTRGPIFAWRLADGRVRWTDTDIGDVELAGVAQAEKDSYAGLGAIGIARELAAAGLEDRVGTVDGRNPWVAGAGLVLALVFLGAVVAGPAPVLGTRWFWFWLVFSAPYGMGLVFWLFRDRPWARVAPRAGEVGRETRDRGWLGLVVGILVSILVSALIVALHG